jgi:hypothetical protein
MRKMVRWRAANADCKRPCNTPTCPRHVPAFLRSPLLAVHLPSRQLRLLLLPTRLFLQSSLPLTLRGDSGGSLLAVTCGPVICLFHSKLGVKAIMNSPCRQLYMYTRELTSPSPNAQNLKIGLNPTPTDPHSRGCDSGK